MARVVWALVLLAGCVPDGGACGNDRECKSGRCYEGICSGSECKCGESRCGAVPSSDCQAGWVCRYVPPDAVSGFFGASGRNTCAATCGHCPDHYRCLSTTDTLCSYDTGWKSPKVTIEGPDGGATGETLAFSA